MRAMQQSAIALATRHNVPYIELNDHVEDLFPVSATASWGYR